MKDKSTKCIRKKVHFEGEADLTQPLTQTDRNQGMLKFFQTCSLSPCTYGIALCTFLCVHD